MGKKEGGKRLPMHSPLPHDAHHFSLRCGRFLLQPQATVTIRNDIGKIVTHIQDHIRLILLQIVINGFFRVMPEIQAAHFVKGVLQTKVNS